MFSRFKPYLKMQALRQSLLLMLIFLGVLTITGIATLLLAERTFMNELKNELLLQHDAAQDLIKNPSLIATRNLQTPFQVIGFKDASGVIYGSSEPELYTKSGFYQLDLALNKTGRSYSKKQLLEQDWLVYTTHKNGTVLSTGVSIVESVTEPFEIYVGSFLFTGLCVGVFSLIAGVILGFREQRRFKEISTQLSSIALGDLSKRIPTSNKTDDLANIATELNHTTDQLERLIHQTKFLTHSIAHDLKTPLARLRAQLEQALSQEERTKKNGQPINHTLSLSTAIDQTDQIIITFDAMLSIAQIQARYKDRHKDKVDLSNLVKNLHDLYKEHAEELGFSLVCRNLYQPCVYADSSLLSQLLANLIENALRYSHQGSEIIIETLEDGLAVHDHGPGIPESEYERVLQPMYQIDKSRNQGTGLGLAMVKAITDFHDATLKLSSTNPESLSKGLSVTVSFSYTINNNNMKK